MILSHTPIDTLRQHPRNPRNGDVDVIAESLQVNDQYKPIVTTKDGTILAGNHTYVAALSLGWTHLWTVQVDVDPDSDEAHRIMLVDNRSADLGTYDDGQLLNLLNDLPALVGTGYTTDDWATLLHQADFPLTDDDFDICPTCGKSR